MVATTRIQIRIRGSNLILSRTYFKIAPSKPKGNKCAADGNIITGPDFPAKIILIGA